MALHRGVAIVGTGAAGWSTAESLRRNGYTGGITLIGNESTPDYDRPPLSKQVLTGEWSPERAVLLSPERVQSTQARVLLDSEAVGLDVTGHSVILADGREVPYEHAVIATGVRPRRLPGWDLAGVHVLRTMSDAACLRRAILRSKNVVIIGAGFVGLEAASSAREMGASVVVIEPTLDPLANRLGQPVAHKLIEQHSEHGVVFHLGATAVPSQESIEQGVIVGVTVSDGSTIATDCVLLCVGCVPSTEWLRGVDGVDIENGVLCDSYGRVLDRVWAAGDVARWLHPTLGRHIRVEHRQNAAEHGTFVARNILGALLPIDTVPFFWTDQYDTKVQVAGMIEPDSPHEFLEGSLNDDAFVLSFDAHGHRSAVIGWNSAKSLTAYRRDIRLNTPRAHTLTPI